MPNDTITKNRVDELEEKMRLHIHNRFDGTEYISVANIDTKEIQIIVLDPTVALSVGDGKAYFRISELLSGMKLIRVGAAVVTASSSGTPTIQIARIRGGSATDMLLTKITLDANEVDSSTAAISAVIDSANNELKTADQIRIDIDVAGTGTKGLMITLELRYM